MHFLSTIRNFIITLRHNSYMLKCLVRRQLESRYSGSLIGLFWSVVNPLAMFLTYSFIFTLVFKARLSANGGTENFALWLLCGILPWAFFSETIALSLSVIIDNKNLITKTVYPSELLPIGSVLSNVVNHAIIFVVIFIIVIVMERRVSLTIFFLPIFFSLLVVFVTGLSWIVSALNVYVKDIEHIVSVVINFWFFYTPIIYDPSMLPERFLFFLKLNPMFHLVQGYRFSILGVSAPSLSALVLLTIETLITLVIGGLIFKRLKSDFAEVL
ncbi:ABC-2 type transporter [Candidatus Magnetoovum chiemensis]|nr:ABC-2 type transporter [Candidatus Magnetoovum chiemensis]